MSAKSEGKFSGLTIDLVPLARGFDRAVVRFMQMSAVALALLLLSETARQYSATLVGITIAAAFLLGILES